MRIFLLLTFLTSLTTLAKAQKVDSIYFHPYTDSLKKGTYNYINVDGKLSNGRWLPLTTKEIELTSSAGVFSGNSLFIDSSFSGIKITLKAVLKENRAISKELTLYIKTTISNERLKTTEELMEEWKKKSKEKKKRKGTVNG
jgi:glycerophosphoryl diester phosphodiesterase